jgi:uncharacterized protein with PIN domain
MLRNTYETHRCPLCNKEVETTTIKVIGVDSYGETVMGCLECASSVQDEYRLQVEADTASW